MSSIDSAQLRAALERTGRLATRDTSDPGHISDFWRDKIGTLCDAIDRAAEGANVAAPDVEEAKVEALIRRAHTALFTELPAERLTRAVWLIEAALPRMRSLNNAFSPTWVRLAEAFLNGELPD